VSLLDVLENRNYSRLLEGFIHINLREAPHYRTRKRKNWTQSECVMKRPSFFWRWVKPKGIKRKAMRTFEVECLNIAKYCSSLQIDPPHFTWLCWLCDVSCWKVEIRSKLWIASQANSKLFRSRISDFKKTYIDCSYQGHLLSYLHASCISFSDFNFASTCFLRCSVEYCVIWLFLLAT